MAERRSWIEPGVCGLSVRRQCELLGLHRSNVYYEPAPESADELRLMRLIDEEYLRRPYLGSRGMALHLARQGVLVNRKKMQRLLRKMGLQAIAPGPSTTQRAAGHKVYPYLLRGVEIVRPNQVWACDITYVPMQRGYLYLTAVMDWLVVSVKMRTFVFRQVELVAEFLVFVCRLPSGGKAGCRDYAVAASGASSIGSRSRSMSR